MQSKDVKFRNCLIQTFKNKNVRAYERGKLLLPAISSAIPWEVLHFPEQSCVNYIHVGPRVLYKVQINGRNSCQICSVEYNFFNEHLTLIKIISEI